jgi:hypothetical protein
MSQAQLENQVVSKQRVTDHGEVYTSAREVNAMLDLVKQETERIESRFLEPACGDGNFLAEILERKLRVVESRYGKSQLEYERNAVLAVTSVYGIDILEDNVLKCRQRLFDIFDKKYSEQFKAAAKDECRDSVKYILARNIVHGDALSLKTVDGTAPIVFFRMVAGQRQHDQAPGFHFFRLDTRLSTQPGAVSRTGFVFRPRRRRFHSQAAKRFSVDPLPQGCRCQTRLKIPTP